MEIKNDNTYFCESGDHIWIKRKNGTDGCEEYILAEKLGSGNEGSVFLIKGLNGSSYVNDAVKILTNPKAGRLETLINEIDNISDSNKDNREKGYICWPKGIVYRTEDKSKVIGYLMRRIPENAITIKQLIDNINDRTAEKKYINSRKDLVDICYNIVSMFKKLHSLADGRLLMGDVNPNNILLNPKSNAVYFIDVDSYQYTDSKGTLWPCIMSNEQFTSPRLYEVRNNDSENIERTKDDELFATAILYYYILSLGQSPFALDGVKLSDSIKNGRFVFDNKHKRTTPLWDNLYKDLKDMFIHVVKNKKYYSDKEWANTLAGYCEAIGEKQLSNELFPLISPLKNADFIKGNCSGCDCEMEILVGEDVPKNFYCRSCLNKAKGSKWFVCKKCGREFVLNFNQINDNPESVCPDCRTDNGNNPFVHFDVSKLVNSSLANFKNWKSPKSEEDFITDDDIFVFNHTIRLPLFLYIYIEDKNHYAKVKRDVNDFLNNLQKNAATEVEVAFFNSEELKIAKSCSSLNGNELNFDASAINLQDEYMKNVLETAFKRIKSITENYDKNSVQYHPPTLALSFSKDCEDLINDIGKKILGDKPFEYLFIDNDNLSVVTDSANSDNRIISFSDLVEKTAEKANVVSQNILNVLHDKGAQNPLFNY